MAHYRTENSYYFEGHCLPGCDIMLSTKYLPVSWRNLLTPSSGWKNHYYTVKMEAAGSSKKFVNIYKTTWHYISEDNTLHNHRTA
jgi:hypothetical protein